ncbi:hypothetical protein JCM6882_005707 [Rhodosporidiobolus microsporus]
MSSTPPDPLPHGLPLRFRNLAIPDHHSDQKGDHLVPDLLQTLKDAATLGPLRRAVRTVAPTKQQARQKMLVSGVEGVVNQGEMLLVIGPPTSNASTLVRALSHSNDFPLSDRTHLDYGLVDHSAASRPRLFPSSSSSSNSSRDDAKERNLRSQVVFMDDRDVHFATLSLESTLRPVAHSKTPAHRQDGSTRAQWAEGKMRSVVDALGLSHALGTAVGNPLVRGLSGGERKRASLAEVLLARAAVLLLDGPFNGLDSSTAVSLLEYLKTWAKEGQRSVVVTTPHCADALYSQFDKVLVLSSRGRQVYFGKSSEAQAYFEQLGLRFNRRVDLGEGTAEFLVGCIEGRKNDLHLERLWASSTQRTALLHEMEHTYPERYPLSSCADPLFAALRADKSRFTPASSHYTVSFARQVALLTRRQYALIRSELPALATKTAVNLLLSLTVGTLFLRLPATTEHAFTRGSLLLLSIMFNAYLSLAELGKTIEGRDIVKRQGDYGFFSAGALAVARVLGDIPLIGVQCTLFGTITYLLAGLQWSLPRFLIYLLFVFSTALNLSCLFRMIAALSPDFESAIRVCGVALNILVMYAGYFIPTPSLRSGLKWIHYVVDPISYSYEAVLANEFHSLDLACSPQDIVPSGPTYPSNPTYQTCALPGSTPGSLTVSGDAYLSLTYDFHYDRLARNLAILAVQAAVFLAIGVVATEVLHFAPGGSTRLWKATGAVKRRLMRKKHRREFDYKAASSTGSSNGNGNGRSSSSARRSGESPSPSRTRTPLLDPEDEEGLLVDQEEGRGGAGFGEEIEMDTDADGGWSSDEEEDDYGDGREREEASALRTPDGGSVDEREEEVEGNMEGSVLSWNNVSLWVDTPLETRRLLDRVSGYIKPGRVTALLGASGAGKSTLLNTLAGRSVGVVRGVIRVDGLEPDKEFYRTTGYVEQFDLHDERSSVREALEFSALLRQPASTPDSDKLAYVDHVLSLLDLTHLQDAIIGSPGAGLSAEQRKRLTIAVEVVSKPAILFCDEPTTGQDTKSALRIVKLLRRLARTGLPVICTIHQPSAETFSIFDDVLLLQRGGKQVYFGPRKSAIDFFLPPPIEDDPAPAPTHTNPADFLLDVTKKGVDVPDEELSELAGLDALNEKWTGSPEYRTVKEELERLGCASGPTTRAASPTQQQQQRPPPPPSASRLRECLLLTQRVSRNYFRDPSFSFTKLFTSSVVPLVIGLSFFRVGTEHTIVSMRNRTFSVFLLLFVPVVWMNAIIFKVHALRALWDARERPSGIYGRTAFATSLLVSEVPYSVACASAYFLLWYFLIGFPLEGSSIGFAFLLIQIFYFFQSTWALWIVSISRQLGTIANLLPFFLVAMEAFNGSLMPYAQMPWYWRWLYYISPFQHYVRAMLGELLHGIAVECSTAEIVSFRTPEGRTCADYAADYLASHAGHLLDPTSTELCNFCPLSTGDEFLATLNMTHSTRWSSLVILGLYSLSNVALVYALTFYPPRLPAFAAKAWEKVTGTAAGSTHKRAEQVAQEQWAAEMRYERELGAAALVGAAHDPFA